MLGLSAFAHAGWRSPASSLDRGLLDESRPAINPLD
jgi:hypothetical protein